MVTSNSSSPGWYPDPDGLGGERFWDGLQWTTRRSAAFGAPVPSPDNAAMDYSQSAWTCPYGHQNVVGQGFCGQCGAPLVVQRNRPTSAGKISPKILAIVAAVAVALVVLVVVIVNVTSEPHRGGVAGSNGHVTGTQDDWIEAVCGTGTFHDGIGGFPGASGSAFCVARVDGTTTINISQFDSDFKMRNAMAMMRIEYYVAATRPDGVLLAISVVGGGTSSALDPLTRFGFTVDTGPTRQ